MTPSLPAQAHRTPTLPPRKPSRSRNSGEQATSGSLHPDCARPEELASKTTAKGKVKDWGAGLGPSVAAPAAGEAVIRAHALERTRRGGPETHSWPAPFPGDWHAHATRIPYLEPRSPWPQPVRNEKSEICYGHRCRRVGVTGAPSIGSSRRNHPRTGVCFLFQGDGRSN